MTTLDTAVMDAPAHPSVADHQGIWIVACCEPNREHCVIREVSDLWGVPHFRPRYEHVRTYTDRKDHKHRDITVRSLFPGYISFCCGEGQQRHVSGCDDVYRVIWEPKQAAFVRSLTLIEASLAANPRIETYPVSTIGERCRIKSGPFRGTEGELVEIRGETKFVVLVEAFGRKVEMQIDPVLLEPA